jgi:hypothetical protein
VIHAVANGGRDEIRFEMRSRSAPSGAPPTSGS